MQVEVGNKSGLFSDVFTHGAAPKIPRSGTCPRLLGSANFGYNRGLFARGTHFFKYCLLP